MSTCTIVDALVVDELPVLWFDRIGAEDSPVHDDVWSSDVVHVEAEGRKNVTYSISEEYSIT